MSQKRMITGISPQEIRELNKDAELFELEDSFEENYENYFNSMVKRKKDYLSAAKILKNNRGIFNIMCSIQSYIKSRRNIRTEIDLDKISISFCIDVKRAGNYMERLVELRILKQSAYGCNGYTTTKKGRGILEWVGMLRRNDIPKIPGNKSIEYYVEDPYDGEANSYTTFRK